MPLYTTLTASMPQFTHSSPLSTFPSCEVSLGSLSRWHSPCCSAHLISPALNDQQWCLGVPLQQMVKEYDFITLREKSGNLIIQARNVKSHLLRNPRTWLCRGPNNASKVHQTTMPIFTNTASNQLFCALPQITRDLGKTSRWNRVKVKRHKDTHIRGWAHSRNAF